MRTLLALGVALSVAATAMAAPNVAQNTQKGSLLIFPDIDVRGARQTIVRIQNDGPRDVQVKCYYLDGNKHRVDLQFPLTVQQPLWFDARTGDGTGFVTPYPNTPSNGFDGTTPLGAGLLTCWVVDVEGTHQLRWNHLAGTATVIDHAIGAAYEYTVYAFYAPTGTDLAPLGTPGTLKLDGVEYDACPLYMIGRRSPAPGRLGTTRVAITGCTIALQQDWTPVWTKLVYDTWNEQENKFSGAFECADTWHESFVSGSSAARFRVQAVSSTQCRPVVGADAVAVGVLAIQSTDLVLANGAHALVGTSLTAAGKQPNGRVTWDPGIPTPEGGIR